MSHLLKGNKYYGGWDELGHMIQHPNRNTTAATSFDSNLIPNERNQCQAKLDLYVLRKLMQNSHPHRL